MKFKGELQLKSTCTVTVSFAMSPHFIFSMAPAVNSMLDVFQQSYGYNARKPEPQFALQEKERDVNEGMMSH